MPIALVTPTQFRDSQAEYLAPLRDAGFELRFPTSQDFVTCEDAFVDLLDGVDCVMASTEPYTDSLLARTRLKAIARTGVGYDSIDVAAATRHGVVVTITPGAVDGSVIEHALALMFGIYRDVLGRDREVRQGKWSRQGGPRLAGQTLGIVGFGRIGRAMARLAQQVGLKVIAHDPFPHQAFAQQHAIKLCELEELLSIADIVSLHLPSTEQTRHMINAETLALMKPDATLINTGRGPLVDEEALYDAMSAGHLRGAGLDVFQQEPLPLDSRLLELPNVILSTHTAGLDHQSEYDMPRKAAECLAELSVGGWPGEAVINRDLEGSWQFDR